MQKHQQEACRAIRNERHVDIDSEIADAEIALCKLERESNGSSNEEHALFLKRQRTRLISLATRTAMARANPGSRMFGLILMATWQRLARDAGLYGDGEEQSSNGASEPQSSNGATPAPSPNGSTEKPFPWPVFKGA